MSTSFHPFSAPHIALVALIPLVAWLLVRWTDSNDQRTRLVRYLLAGLIALNDLTWYGYYVSQGWFVFPSSLPLQLCDIVRWLTIIALVTKQRWTYEPVYYWGLAGTTLAILTPDVTTPPLSYPTLQFFFAHGGTVVGILFLVFRKVLHPGRGSHFRAWILLHGYAAAIGVFNVCFRANYFYLCEKPEQVTLLSFMGPWPVYLLVGDILAMVIFWILSLPFRKGG